MICYLEIIEQGVDIVDDPQLIRVEVADKAQAVALYPSLIGEFSGLQWKAYFHTHRHAVCPRDSLPCLMEEIAHGA